MSNGSVIIIVTTAADWEDAKVKDQKQNFKKEWHNFYKTRNTNFMKQLQDLMKISFEAHFHAAKVL